MAEVNPYDDFEWSNLKHLKIKGFEVWTPVFSMYFPVGMAQPGSCQACSAWFGMWWVCHSGRQVGSFGVEPVDFQKMAKTRENERLEPPKLMVWVDVSPFPRGHFQVPAVSFQGCISGLYSLGPLGYLMSKYVPFPGVCSESWTMSWLYVCFVQTLLWPFITHLKCINIKCCVYIYIYIPLALRVCKYDRFG